MPCIVSHMQKAKKKKKKTFRFCLCFSFRYISFLLVSDETFAERRKEEHGAWSIYAYALWNINNNNNIFVTTEWVVKPMLLRYMIAAKSCWCMRRMCMGKGICDGSGTMPNESWPPDYNDIVWRQRQNKKRSEWQYVVYKRRERWNMAFYHFAAHPPFIPLTSEWKMWKRKEKHRVDVLTRARRDKKALRYLWRRVWRLWVRCRPHVVACGKSTTTLSLICFGKAFYFSHKQPEPYGEDEYQETRGKNASELGANTHTQGSRRRHKRYFSNWNETKMSLVAFGYSHLVCVCVRGFCGPSALTQDRLVLDAAGCGIFMNINKKNVIRFCFVCRMRRVGSFIRTHAPANRLFKVTVAKKRKIWEINLNILVFVAYNNDKNNRNHRHEH